MGLGGFSRFAVLGDLDLVWKREEVDKKVVGELTKVFGLFFRAFFEIVRSCVAFELYMVGPVCHSFGDAVVVG